MSIRLDLIVRWFTDSNFISSIIYVQVDLLVIYICIGILFSVLFIGACEMFFML
uniref:Uncharacterized protein n=1 Tax=Triticum urartu TaxID=4572 RepID=A0A8R7R4P5_TRIUA